MQIAPVTSDSQTTTPKAHGFSGLGENDFLQLFITKMQNQDPLSPADDQALVAQLAQFSTLEQQVQSKDLLSQLVASQQAASSARLVDLLGRGALVTGVPAHVTGGACEPLSAQLGGDAAKVKVDIVDGSGAIVRTLDLGAHAAGRFSFAWDGKDAQGNTVADGDYTLRVAAKDASGGDVAAAGMVSVRIDALRPDGGTLMPLSMGRAISLDDIIELSAS
ncbi:MAG: hypothetical protein HY049_04780 [Acidobacteria bacterium]|nr:hypothetical protein [Acidobacteriota bacterium]